MNETRAAKTRGVILLVDDEKAFRENVAEHFEANGFRVLEAGDAPSALAQMERNAVDVAFLDVLMPGMDGVTLLTRLKEIDPLLEVVIVTGQGSIESAVEAMRRGAYHYVTKPVRLREIEMVARRAIEKTLVARQNRLFREDLRRRRAHAVGEIIAESPTMRSVLEKAEQVARTDGTVLIQGETGVGKEVLAEFIHGCSARSDHVMSVVNCGALSDSLLDAELFGYVKGAFTGADDSRPGILEVANEGTLLLDEIGDLSMNGQMRLLRFLERGLVRRVGSARETTLDVRVLAATHRDLLQASENGKFRKDLYHRLHVFSLAVPPLRKRIEDVLPLAHHYLSDQLSPGSEPPEITEEAREALLSYRWPGNVRELRHAVERARFAVQLSGERAMRPEHLGLNIATSDNNMLLSLKDAQARHIRTVLEHFEGNRQRAAEVLGVSERHLYRLLSKLKQGAPGSVPPPPPGEQADAAEGAL